MRISHILTLFSAILLLSACAASGTKNAPNTSTTATGDSLQPNLNSASIDRAMEKAIANAEASGNTQEALALLEKAHKRHQNDPLIATRYARALRNDEQISSAIRVLKPYTKGDLKNVEAITEMSMTQLALGDFKAAENYALNAIEMDEKNARAYLALGTAQDAQSKHQEAETSFRQGLKFWKGDASPILNNLALNLASQGHLKEALALIEKAQKMSPNRLELERNRRIIATLLETAGSPPPAPGAKPKVE